MLGVASLIAILNSQFPSTLQDTDSVMRLVYALSLLALVGSSLFFSQRINMRVAVKQALTWACIFVALIAVYSFRAEFMMLGDRMGGELTPSRPSGDSAAPGIVTLRKSVDGHFVVDASVNGRPVRFLVDTGASDVSLTMADAKRAGVNINSLRFTAPYQTANGLTMGAKVRLNRIDIGSIRLYDVEASVMQEGLGVSLLGMSFLGRLSALEVAGDQLVLKE